MATDPAISIRGLTKSFGGTRVLCGVDLDLPRGSIFGFLGRNGAGKTTTIQVLLGLLRPDAGSCSVLGLDPAVDPVGVRRRIGYMAENQAMYAWMRVGELIDWCGKFYPTWDARLAESFRGQMALPADRRVGGLSKGQTSKLALLLALAHQPEVVILDDPVLGLDPLARRDFLRDVIGQLQSRSVTVFFSSHLLYEIEPICDRIAILDGGRIVAAEEVDALRARVKRVELRLRPGAQQGSVPGLLDARVDAECWTAIVEDIDAARPALAGVSQNGVTVSDLNLDEIFEAFVAGRKEAGR